MKFSEREKNDVEASRKRAAAQAHLPSVLEPHRAGRIRIIVLIGFIFCLGALLGWAMGARDLKEMDLGRMDPSGRELTDKWRKIGKTVLFVWLGLNVLLFLLILATSCN